MKLFLRPNHKKPDYVASARETCLLLTEAGYECYFSPSNSQKIFGDGTHIANPEDCDVIVALGGDGTVLRAAQLATECKKPLIGINVGHLGFLCAGDTSIIESGFIEKMHETKHTYLTFEADGKKYKAFNDVYVFKRNLGTTVLLNVSCGRNKDTYKADGLIVSTPTGSTSYNRSAGGPIVDWNAEVNVITPICPHFSSAGSIVVSDRDEIVVATHEGYDDGAAIFADGVYICEITEPLVIKTSDYKLSLLTKGL